MNKISFSFICNNHNADMNIIPISEHPNTTKLRKQAKEELLQSSCSVSMCVSPLLQIHLPVDAKKWDTAQTQTLELRVITD